MEKKLTTKELPDSERPYEKCLKYGAECLSDAELIAAIIRTGTKEETAKDLAERLLVYAPDHLLNLTKLSMDELQSIRGIGPVKAVQLKCVTELASRLAQAKCRDSIVLRDPKSIADYYMQRFRHKSRENLLLTMYDSKGSLIGDEVISVGTVNASLISPREVFLTALKYHAVYIVLLHNHPSGAAEPSREDFEVTDNLKECGVILGIPLEDHIIIGDNVYFSFREEKLL